MMPRLSLVKNDPLAPSFPSRGRAKRGLWHRLGLSSALRLIVLAPPLVGGCAGPNQVARGATRVPFAELDRGEGAAALTSIRERPVVIEFRAGQVVPVDLMVESSLFEVDVPELELRAKRDFFLLLHADGPPMLSEDGVEFERRPKNSFLLGFQVRKAEKARLSVGFAVRPEPREPAP